MNATKTLLGLVACAAMLAAAPPAGAQGAAGAKPGADAAASAEAEDWSSWIKTLEQGAQKLRELRKTEAALQTEVGRALSRRYPRGEEKEKLLAAHARAQKDLAEAREQLPELIEQARQAGVPQGMLQEYEDLAVEPAPANADGASGDESDSW